MSSPANPHRHSRDGIVGQVDQDLGPVSVLSKDSALCKLLLHVQGYNCAPTLFHTDAPCSSAAEPLRSTSSLPERVYNLCYTPATGRILVSMAHRHVSVYAAYELSNASQEGRDAKADHTRESALKMLTRSVACMADGKGECSRPAAPTMSSTDTHAQAGHLPRSRAVSPSSTLTPTRPPRL